MENISLSFFENSSDSDAATRNLTIDSYYGSNSRDLPYGVPLMIFFLFSIFLLFWLLLVNFLREKGCISRDQADQILEELGEFPIRVSFPIAK